MLLYLYSRVVVVYDDDDDDDEQETFCQESSATNKLEADIIEYLMVK